MAKPCTVNNCNNPRFSGGLCLYHKKASNPSKYQIHSKTPLKGNSVSKPRIPKPISKISTNLVKQLAKYKVVRDEYMLTHPVCEFPKCHQESTDLHHKSGRSGEMLTNVQYFCALCRSHHNWVHENDSKAREMGLLLSRLGK